MQRKQTLNKDAETSGRVTQFPSSSTQYKKRLGTDQMQLKHGKIFVK